MPIDRQATLKTAEKLLRQGKLDGAIAEYVRLVDDQPKDWNSINALGDLYARAGDKDRAIEQFTRVADHLRAEGFLPKAAALYKKALKTRNDHEPTLLRLAEIAGEQELIADARSYLRQLAELRRGRGDSRGAAECQVRIGMLDDADVDAKLNAGRAAQEIGDVASAAALLKEAASQLEEAGRTAEALDALVDAAQLDPSDIGLRTRLARECVKNGQLERARLFLTLESTGDDPELLMALASIEMTTGDVQQGHATLTRLLTVSPAHHDAVLGLARELSEKGEEQRAYDCVDVLTDAAILSGEWDRAVEGLGWFVDAWPRVTALSKLVEVAVDAGRTDLMRRTQAQLADAYLAAGQGAEARVIAEDLVASGQATPENIQRLRTALELLEVADIERIIGDTLSPGGEVDLVSGAAEIDPLASEISPETEDTPPAIHGSVPDPLPALELTEIDLSEALADIEAGPVVSPQPAAAASGLPRQLESVFADMRKGLSRQKQVAGAAAQLERGLQAIEEGRVDDAVTELEAAASVPAFRFKAGAALGRLHIGRSEMVTGIDWLERAAEAPAPSPEEGFALLYELADVLELLGDAARALSVLMELDADAGDYRDVRSRIDRLARIQTESHGG